MRIYRLISKKKYLGGKAVYKYETFYVPVPKRFNDVVRPLVDKDIKIKVASTGLTKDCGPAMDILIHVPKCEDTGPLPKRDGFFYR